MGKTKKRKPKRKPMTRKFGMLLMAAYVPAFIYIHFRYARHNFKAWAALFVAPFLVVKLVLIRIIDMLPEQGTVAWHFDLLAIFAISICFYMAERFDKFRRIYVWAVPFIVFSGLIYWANGQGSHETAGFVVKIILIAYFSYRVGKFTTKEGYAQLDDGADEDYHIGKEFYDALDYEQALPHLEKSAERGHFKSLFLLGEAYEKGHHYKRDTVKAAASYYRASRKGYANSLKRYQTLLNQLSSDQHLQLDDELRDVNFRPQHLVNEDYAETLSTKPDVR